MPRRILLLTGRREAPFFRDFLRERNPALEIDAAHCGAELRDQLSGCEAETRLIAFLTDVIVPREILARLGPVAYNIHPGPPEFPGAHPESFAIWLGAAKFGVTGHEIAPAVDAGPVVHVERFRMPARPERRALADMTFPLAVNAFARIGAHCAESDAPLPHLAEAWGTPTRRRAEFRALCRAAAETPPDRLDRLRRACGEDFASAGPVRPGADQGHARAGISPDGLP